MQIEPSIPLIDETLECYRADIGADFAGYRNHVYRVVHFCFALYPCEADARRKIVIAGCFHDLGIWTNHTVDYLQPSCEHASAYLRARGLSAWQDEIVTMIDMHHKIRPFQSDAMPLVEVFRKADLVDVSLGLVRFDLASATVKAVKAGFPDEGFHRRLIALARGWFLKHPGRPPPFMKW
jgi:hypothetical protein